jgi:copper(I)-binding protein
MGRWLIAFALGLMTLGAVFFLWKQESAEHAQRVAAQDATIQMGHGGHAAGPTTGMPAGAPAAAGPAPAGEAAPSAADTAPANASASAEGVIVVDEPWARAGTAGGTTAAFMLMTNTSQAPDRIVTVSSPDATEAAIHETRIDSKNVATMRPANHADLDPGVPLVFEPGGLHVMLSGLKHPLKEGDALTVVFTFQHAGTLSVKVPVGELTGDGDSVQP